jgi:uncharacterized protein DUF6869
MVAFDHRSLIDDFRRFYEKQPSPPAQQNCDIPEFWAITRLDELAHKEPDIAWLLILQLLGQELPDIAVSCLAAGPLEDLIQYHGPEVIARIESEAAANPLFRNLLGGVWESGTPEVWARILKVRGDPW